MASLQHCITRLSVQRWMHAHLFYLFSIVYFSINQELQDLQEPWYIQCVLLHSLVGLSTFNSKARALSPCHGVMTNCEMVLACDTREHIFNIFLGLQPIYHHPSGGLLLNSDSQNNGYLFWGSILGNIYYALLYGIQNSQVPKSVNLLICHYDTSEGGG